MSSIPSNRYTEAIFPVGIIKKVIGEKRQGGWYPPPPSSPRVKRLKLQTLEHRRLIADLVLYYNIVHGLSCIDVTSFFTPSNNSSLRGHDFRFFIPISKLNIRRHFLAHRSKNAWNSLPASVVSATSIFAFKRSLLKIDLSKHLHVK